MPKTKQTKDDDFRDAPVLAVRVNKKTRERAEAYAAKQLWSLSQLGNVAIEEYLSRHAK